MCLCMDGEFKMVQNSGKQKIPGDQLGGKRDILEYKEEKMFWEFKLGALGVHHSIHGLTILEIKQFRIIFYQQKQ